MALYQGEDISISLSGEGLANLDVSKFVVLICSRINEEECYEIQGNEFTKRGEVYSAYIPKETTLKMNGYYDIEIMLEDSTYPSKRSIYVKEDAIFVNKSKIGTHNINY